MSDKNSKVIFRTAMGGYNKNDVNTYIESENRRFASAEQEMRSEQKRLESELENARLSLKRCESVSESLANAKVELDRLKNELESTKAELERYEGAAEALVEAKGEISRLKDELDRAKSELAAANEQPDTAKDAHGAENESVGNSEEFNSVIAAELLRKAKSASDDILLRAEVGAREIVERARKEVIDSRGDIISDAKDIFNAATSELRRSIAICMSDFITGIKTARGSSGKVTDDALRCDDELSQRIERMQNELDRAISEKLAEFDRKSKDGK